MELKFIRRYTLTVANIVLMVFLFLTIFFVMLFPQTVQMVLYQFGIGGILISALFCIDKKHRRYLRWFVVAAIVLQWTYIASGGIVLNGISKSVVICLYITIAILLVKHAASSKTVTSIVILESINGYLLIGTFYSVIIALIMVFDPAAYHFQSSVETSDELLSNFNEYLYYGFGVFTTATHGDVMPVSPIAKSASMATGITGQMYITVIIAMLVGKYASQGQKK
ncbi:hypothetical protein GZH53_14685 [Flavihumibacter sp. R14]|nr:hypothetical protein [Flavihumibacter soli]